MAWRGEGVFAGDPGVFGVPFGGVWRSGCCIMKRPPSRSYAAKGTRDVARKAFSMAPAALAPPVRLATPERMSNANGGRNGSPVEYALYIIGTPRAPLRCGCDARTCPRGVSSEHTVWRAVAPVARGGDGVGVYVDGAVYCGIITKRWNV